MQTVKKTLLASILTLAFLLATNGFAGALDVGQPAQTLSLIAPRAVSLS